MEIISTDQGYRDSRHSLTADWISSLDSGVKSVVAYDRGHVVEIGVRVEVRVRDRVRFTLIVGISRGRVKGDE